MAASSSVRAFKDWWGSGFYPGEYGTPFFGTFASSATQLLDGHFDPVMRTRIKQFATKSLKASADKYEVGATYAPGGPMVSLDLKAIKGADSVGLSAALKDPAEKYRLPLLSMHASRALPTVFRGQALADSAVLRASVSSVSMDPETKNALVPDREASVSIDARHAAGTTGVSLVQSKAGGKPSLILTESFGSGSVMGWGVGLSGGFEVRVGAADGAVQDYNVAVQLQRKNALSLTLTTQDRLKTLVFAPIAYFGKSQQLALAARFSAPTESLYQSLGQAHGHVNGCGPVTGHEWSAGLQYQLPKAWTDSQQGFVKAKFDSESRASLATHTTMRSPGLSLGFSISTPVALPLLSGVNKMRALTDDGGARVGVSLTLGDNYAEPDAPLPGRPAMFPAAGGCPHCH